MFSAAASQYAVTSSGNGGSVAAAGPDGRDLINGVLQLQLSEPVLTLATYPTSAGWPSDSRWRA